MTEGGQLSPEREAWQSILLEQARRRPSWQLQDVYKLAFQAALGSEHATPDEIGARQWLWREAAAMGEGPADSLYEPISPDHRLVRVNLRPYITAGGDLEVLLQAFLRTARMWQGKLDTLPLYIHWTIDLAESGRLVFPTNGGWNFFQQMEDVGFPPAHHSHLYRQMYQPAYRVVIRELI